MVTSGNTRSAQLLETGCWTSNAGIELLIKFR
jgi:hypothetical protein